MKIKKMLKFQYINNMESFLNIKRRREFMNFQLENNINYVYKKNTRIGKRPTESEDKILSKCLNILFKK